MSIKWADMAVAVSGRLEYERLCNRSTSIDEASVVKHCMEFIQATTSLKLDSEYTHRDLPNGSRIDVVGWHRSSSILKFILEAKWIKPKGGIRNWSSEIIKDILRLESIYTYTNQLTERIIVVAGVKSDLNRKFIESVVNVGQGRRSILEVVLQKKEDNGDPLPYPNFQVSIRKCDPNIRKIFQDQSKKFYELPVSYQVSLIGHHCSGPFSESVEMYVWSIRRSRKRSTFIPKKEW